MERYRYSLVCFLVLGIVGVFAYPKGREVYQHDSGDAVDPPNRRIKRNATAPTNEAEGQLEDSTTTEAGLSDNTSQRTKDSLKREYVGGSTSNPRSFLQEYYTDSRTVQEDMDHYGNVDGREILTAIADLRRVMRNYHASNPGRRTTLSRLLAVPELMLWTANPPIFDERVISMVSSILMLELLNDVIEKSGLPRS